MNPPETTGVAAAPDTPAIGIPTVAAAQPTADAVRAHVLHAWDFVDTADAALVDDPEFGPLQGLGKVKQNLLIAASVLGQLAAARGERMVNDAPRWVLASDPPRGTVLVGSNDPSVVHPVENLAMSIETVHRCTTMLKELPRPGRRHRWRLRRHRRRVIRMLNGVAADLETLMRDIRLLAGYGMEHDQPEPLESPEDTEATVPPSAAAAPPPPPPPSSGGTAPPVPVNAPQVTVNQSAPGVSQAPAAAPTAPQHNGQSHGTSR